MGLLYACDRWIGANKVFKKIEWKKLERERYNKVNKSELCEETDWWIYIYCELWKISVLALEGWCDFW